MTIATINPATGETVKTFEPASDRDIEQVLAKRRVRTERTAAYRLRSALL